MIYRNKFCELRTEKLKRGFTFMRFLDIRLQITPQVLKLHTISKNYRTSSIDNGLKYECSKKIGERYRSLWHQ